MLFPYEPMREITQHSKVTCYFSLCLCLSFFMSTPGSDPNVGPVWRRYAFVVPSLPERTMNLPTKKPPLLEAFV